MATLKTFIAVAFSAVFLVSTAHAQSETSPSAAVSFAGGVASTSSITGAVLGGSVLGNAHLISCGVRLHLEDGEMDAMLAGGARWALERGYGTTADLERIEERGCMAGAEPAQVSWRAKQRQRDEMGTLGSGNHYLEVQRVAEVADEKTATAFQLRPDAIVVSIHCGSRGLGHQIGTDFLKEMAAAVGCGLEAPGSRAGVGTDRIAARRAVPRRHARRDQLCAGQPADHHAPGAAGVRADCAEGRLVAALRRVP